MPSSKRSKVVALTKVKRKDKTQKQQLIQDIKQAAENFEFTYLLSVENQRNAHLKLARNSLKPGRIFYGKNKLMQIALGTVPENEVKDNMHKLSKRLQGERCLLFTNSPPDEVIGFCDTFRPEEFAKAGFVATKTEVILEGNEALSKFPHYMEPQFRKLGMPTLLKDGKIQLMGDYTVCSKGKSLTAEQAQTLKHMDIRMSTFKIIVEACLHGTDFREF